MPTQQQTNSSSSTGMQFDPGSLSTYQNLTKGGGNVLSGYINNPFGNPMYNLGLANSMRGAQAAGQNNMNALNQNQKVSGMSGNAGQGWLGAQRAMMGRSNQAMSSQANMSNIMQAFQRQMGATGMGMSFSPLMTGQSSTGSQTQSTSGTGTWLPQLLGAGMGAAMMGMSGGASAGAKAGGGAGSIMPSSFSSSFGGSNPVSGLTSPFPGFGGGGSGMSLMNPFQASMMTPQ